MRTHTYKYSRFWQGSKHSAAGELLYHLAQDPHEQVNVSGDNRYQSVLAEMRNELLARWFTIENQYPLRTGKY